MMARLRTYLLESDSRCQLTMLVEVHRLTPPRQWESPIVIIVHEHADGCRFHGQAAHNDKFQLNQWSLLLSCGFNPKPQTFVSKYYDAH